MSWSWWFGDEVERAPHRNEKQPEGAPESTRLLPNVAEHETTSGGRNAAPGQVARTMHRLQRDYGNQRVQRYLSGERGGAPLDEATRAQMETAYGENFQDVRVHTGSEGQAVVPSNASAATVGQDIYVGAQAHGAHSNAGGYLIAHELAHVVQQRRGGPAPGAAQEADADRAARAIGRGSSASVATASATGMPQFGPPGTVGVETGTLNVDAPYRIEDVTQLPSEYDSLSMNVRNRTYAAEIANPALTEQQIMSMGADQLPRQVTVRQLKNYASVRGLRVNVLLAKYGGGENLAGYDTFRAGETIPGESVSFRGSVREGYVEGARGVRGAGRALFVRRVEAAVAANAQRMHVGVGSFEETITFHEKLTKAAGMGELVTIEPGKEYWLQSNEMANILAEWGEHLSPTQRQALRELVQAAEAKGKQVAVEEIKKILNESKPPPATGGESGEEGGGEGEGEGGGEGGGEGEGFEGEGGGGGGLFGKILTGIGIVLSGKHLYEAGKEGKEEFGMAAAEEGMIWGSAFTPLGPAGPPTVAFAIWYAKAFTHAMLALPKIFMMLAEGAGELAKHIRPFFEMTQANLLRIYESLNPDNWDTSAMPEDLIVPTDRLGVAVWDKVSKMDMNALSAAVHQPLSALDVSRSAVFAFTSQWELLQTKQTGAPTTLTPDQVLAMTPLQLLDFLKADKLGFIQDPDILTMNEIEDPSALVTDKPHTFGKAERSQLRELVEMRTRVNAYNWDFSAYPKWGTHQDAELIQQLGLTIWSKLQPLGQAEFQTMSRRTLDTFNLPPDLMHKVADALARIAFLGAEIDPELLNPVKEQLLTMTPEQLASYLMAIAQLRFKKDPAKEASDAIEAVEQGYRPW